MAAKPDSLFDREAEWTDLIRFASPQHAALRLGIVYGRRRFGKSYLLRRLVEAVGGVYHLALREERRSALDRFAASLGRQQRWVPAAPVRDWGDALTQAVTLLGTNGTTPQVLVIDEYPYLQQTCGEMDTTVQALMDEAAGGTLTDGWTAPVSIVLCGSAMSVMTRILSGTSALRGRAVLDLPLAAFDYRVARGFWDIDDPAVAFTVDSVVGGAAGYKDLTADAGTPTRLDDVPEWLCATVLNPSHALFREDNYLLREDPRVTDEAVYYSLLGAIADGRTAPVRIAEALGRTSTDIGHHMTVMTTAGFVTRQDDLLRARRPTYRVADPIVCFHHLINRRHRARLEDRMAPRVWSEASATYRSGIVGPHFEAICRVWTDRYASAETLGGGTDRSASLQVDDPRSRQSFQLDVVARRSGDRNDGTTSIQLLGEAKARRLNTDDLARLDRLADLLTRRRGVVLAPDAKRLLFSLDGFSNDLVSTATTRPDVELIDLHRLYEGD
ncbi:AAA family ATPase [Candidatus Poriferisodalis sp.]|uniref:AAA family ATPase n=1 Tax=Candidatus Poriferisodalis sp. TaxID=3101277 RepID=UPI003AF5FD77